MFIDRAIDWIRATPGLTSLWDIHERWSPLRFVRTSRKLVEREVRILREALNSKRRVVFVFDQENSPSGLGDMLSVAMVARGVSNRTRASIFLVDRERTEKTQASAANVRQNNRLQARHIFQRFAPDAELVELTEPGLTTLTNDTVMFEEAVRQSLDTSRYMLLLIREMILQLGFHLKDFGFCLNQNGKFIGYPVRRAAIAPERNTRSLTFLRDIELLASLFPSAEIKLFGFTDEIEYFLNLADENGLGDKVVSQQASDFATSAIEAAQCSLWVQRRGGGIALPIFFSEVPFVFFSRDSVMARQLQLDARQNRLFPWHQVDQRYHLAPFRADRMPLEKALRKMMKQGLGPIV